MKLKEIADWVSGNYSSCLNYELELSYEKGEIKFVAPHYEVTMEVESDYFNFSVKEGWGITSDELDLITHIRDSKEYIIDMLFEEDCSVSYIKCTKCKARKCPTKYGEAKVIDVIMEINGCEFAENCFSWIFKDKKTDLDKWIKKIESTPIKIFESGDGGWCMSQTGNHMFETFMDVVKLHNEYITGMENILKVELD